jgi:uncharacterized protein
MHFEGSVEIAAPRDRVWAFVMDPNQVGQCGPGVESIDVIDDTHFKATAKIGIGFISARFVVNMEFADTRAPDTATIKAHGLAPGSAVDATARMTLSDGGGNGAPDGGGSAGGGGTAGSPGTGVAGSPGTGAGRTTMDWSADVTISGTLASVGARMIEGTADKLIAQTFDCMKAKLES